jgi:hypothetical protein
MRYGLILKEDRPSRDEPRRKSTPGIEPAAAPRLAQIGRKPPEDS